LAISFLSAGKGYDLKKSNYKRMKVKVLESLVLAVMIFSSCKMENKESKQNEMKKFDKGTFGYDLNFLSEKDSVIVLKNNEGNGQLIISPKYQAKVFTSTADGPDGKSFGWINYKVFDMEIDPHMNAYGGEDRLWLGPEGGKFSIFFKPGAQMDFENWKTPPEMDTESWNMVSASSKKVFFQKDMDLLNYSGTRLKLRIERGIEILENADISEQLNIRLNDRIRSVAFRTINTIINTGEKEWNKQTGAPCLWNLDMFSPSAKTVIVIPYEEGATGKVATTDYFGEIPANRIGYEDGILLFKADGKSRGKLGIPPTRARNVAGSYDASDTVLTITLFDVDNKATYLNQEWTLDKDPFTGDAVNAYNDGPLANGDQMGPFYEIESVSPAAFLKPNAELSHQHSVFHFTGDKAQLDQIAMKVLGISLNKIESAFNKLQK
jgi:hypothetical protein